MTTIDPPKDFDRAEKKAFRKHAETLAKAGVDVALRADLIADFVRSDSRLKGLREAEKTAETGQKLAANRAVTTASAERRRLHEQLYRGASLKPRTRAAKVQAVMNAEPDTSDESEACEAWRDIVWWWARGKPEPTKRDRMRVRSLHGEPGMEPLLYAFAEERQAWRALRAASSNPSGGEIEALRDKLPLRLFTHELRAPGARERVARILGEAR